MAVEQIGEFEVVIGFGDYCITGYLPDSVALECGADIQEIRNCDNEVAIKLISNKFKRIRVEAIVKAGEDAPTIPCAGDVFTVNSVAYLCESTTKTYSRDALKVSITGIKEDSMTYTAP